MKFTIEHRDLFTVPEDYFLCHERLRYIIDESNLACAEKPKERDV